MLKKGALRYRTVFEEGVKAKDVNFLKVLKAVSLIKAHYNTNFL